MIKKVHLVDRATLPTHLTPVEMDSISITGREYNILYWDRFYAAYRDFDEFWQCAEAVRPEAPETPVAKAKKAPKEAAKKPVAEEKDIITKAKLQVPSCALP